MTMIDSRAWTGIAGMLAMIFFCSLNQSLANVVLVRERQPTARIVIADDATLTARHAASEFADHLRGATGAVLPIVAESDAPQNGGSRVYVGVTQAARRHGLETGTLEPDAYILRVIGNDLFVLGRESALPDTEFNFIKHQSEPNGTLFGVYELLDRYLGVRWLWPGELGTYIPPRDTMVIEDTLNEVHAPRLKFRIFRTAGVRHWDLDHEPEPVKRLAFSEAALKAYQEDLALYLGRHRVGGGHRKPVVGHYFHDWWGTYGDRHPEWFMLRPDGKRGPVRGDERRVAMCVSNTDLHRYIVDNAWDGGEILRLGEVDRRLFCDCQDCRAWDGPQPERPPDFARDDYHPRMVSDRYARFWKTIQAMAAERNPEVTVTTFLYLNNFPAPTGDLRLNANIYGEFVPWLSRYAWFPMPPPMERWLREQWSGWEQTGMRMALRPNYLLLGYVMPHLSTRQAGDFFKYAVEHGMEGFDQDSLVGHWAVQGPMLYVHMRLAWKPEMSVDAIRREYFSAFGDAAPIVERYFDYWEDYALTRPGGNLRNLVDANIAYPPDVFVPAQALLAEADAIVRRDPRPEYRQRVRFLSAGLEHARLAARFMGTLERGRVSRRPARFRESQAALNELIAWRREYEHLYIANLWSAARHEHRRTEVAKLLVDPD